MRDGGVAAPDEDQRPAPFPASSHIGADAPRSRLFPPFHGGKSVGVVPRLTLALIALLAVEVLLVGLDTAFPPDLSKAYRSSPVALDKDGGWLRALPVEQGRWRIRADLDRTDPSFVARVIALEDKHFWVHPGVDPLSALRAAASALIHGRITSGASTLTMQTARLLEPRPRTWSAKLFQMVRALQLQARFSKRETLALYLTLAPYGGNLEGVRAASLSYFGHEPETLTPGEQALLIALPQSPEARRPDRKPAVARAARDRVLERMAAAGLITSEAAQEGSSEPLPAKRLPFPSLAWQAAGEIAKAAPLQTASVVTTIDADLQRRLEPMAAKLAKSQGPDAEVAILVIEAKNRAVRAAVGSAGLDAPSGWMDMTRALRSPGSALKPFIYGMAMDEGIVAPDTQLDDAPQRFSDYQPEDFDRIFHGPVTMREALIHSLNVPAVATLERLGPATFEARLTGVGARLVRPQSETRDAGLALALGGEGISLRDIAMLYAAMADDGIAKPLAWTEADAADRLRSGGQRLMRDTSARAILDILRDGPPPKGRAPDALTRVTPMAFKTGTSYGFRDAVAIGVAGGYVIAIWTGRADGGARPDLTGREAALPFLFDVADQVGGQGATPPQISPRAPPSALRTLEQVNHGPRLIFPPDGASIIADGYGPTSRGFVLAAGGDGLTWYVDGVVVPNDPVSGHPLWRPPGPGFYRLSVVDSAGRTVQSHVRVKGGG